jgi:PPK2 family polyphosphate:nucleotide phosphotransferase
MLFSDKYLAKPENEIKLSKISTSDTLDYKTKDDTKKLLKQNIKKMIELQGKLYAHNKYSVLIVFQAMDAAGKDSTIKSVMSGLNPQGTQVYSFKQPSTEELDHDYLWRIHKVVPERGRIGIFNRSHYEEVLVVRVHNFIKNQNLPEKLNTKDVWQKRYEQIKNFEKHLYENGTIIMKFFLHVSKEEQKKRFLKRIDNESKNWKFSAGDIEERKYWNDYRKCYEEAINATTKNYSPWFIIPADHKWFMQFAVSQIINEQLEKADISYPRLSKEQLKKLGEYRKILTGEK